MPGRVGALIICGGARKDTGQGQAVIDPPPGGETRSRSRNDRLRPGNGPAAWDAPRRLISRVRMPPHSVGRSP